MAAATVRLGSGWRSGCRIWGRTAEVASRAPLLGASYPDLWVLVSEEHIMKIRAKSRKQIYVRLHCKDERLL